MNHYANKPLKQWGVALEVSQAYGLKCQGANFKFDSAPGHRARILFSQALANGTKSLWVEGDTRPQAVLFGLEQLPEGCTVFIANGEKAVMSNATAGVHSVCTFGEGNRVSEAVVQLKERGIKRVIVIPDCDAPGRRAARKWLAACALAGLECIVLDLQLFLQTQFGMTAGQCHKWDMRDLWLLLEQNPDTFRAALENLPILDFSRYAEELPKEQPTRPHRDYTPSTAPSAALYERWQREIVIPALERVSPSNKGIHEHRHCPNPHHADQHPSFRIGEKGAPICTCGTITWDMLAEWVGAQSWADYKRDHHQPRHTGTAKNQRESAEQTRVTREQVLQGLRDSKKPKVKASKPLAQLIKPYNVPSFTADLTVDLPYVSELDPAYLFKYFDLALRSAMATGKTEWIKRLIIAFEAIVGYKPSILIIGHLQGLARNQAERLGIECYETFDDYWLARVPSVACTIHSSGKLAQTFDIVVIDEATQVLRAFGDQETWKKVKKGQVGTFEDFQALLRRARYVVLCDANLDDLTVNAIGTIRGKLPFRIENTYRPPKPTMLMYAKHGALIKKLINYAKQGKRMAIAFGSKKGLKNFHRMLLDEGIDPALIQAVHGDNSFEPLIQEFTSTINESCKNIQILLYTSTYGSGIDITTHFDIKAGVFGRKFSAEAILQMLGRVRNADEVHIYVTPTSDGTAQTDAAKLEKADQDRAALTAAYVGASDAQKDAARALSWTLNQFRADDNRQRNNLPSAVYAYAQKEGYPIAFVEAESPETEATLKAIGEVLEAERKAARIAAEPIDFDALESHRRKGTITQAHRDGHARWRIEDCVGQAITSDLYDDLHKPVDRAKLRLLTSLRSDEKYAIERDRAEIDNDVLPMHRKHATPRRRLTLELLKVVFGVTSADDLQFLKERLTEEEIKRRAAVWIAANLRNIRHYIDERYDLSDDSLAVVRRVLGSVKIKLDYCQQRINGERVYTYSVDKQELARWLAYSDSRIAHLEQKEAEKLGTNEPVSIPVDIQQNNFRVLRQPPPESPLERQKRQATAENAAWGSLPISERLAFV